MEISDVMTALESAGKERTQKYYRSQGAREPRFGVPISFMTRLPAKSEPISRWRNRCLPPATTTRYISRA